MRHRSRQDIHMLGDYQGKYWWSSVDSQLRLLGGKKIKEQYITSLTVNIGTQLCYNILAKYSARDMSDSQ